LLLVGETGPTLDSVPCCTATVKLVKYVLKIQFFHLM
jgi:hypothetical protein